MHSRFGRVLIAPDVEQYVGFALLDGGQLHLLDGVVVEVQPRAVVDGVRRVVAAT